MKTLNTVILAAALALGAVNAPIAYAGAKEDAIAKAITAYMPGTSALGKLKVESVTVNDKNKTIAVKLNETGAYIPLTATSLERMKADFKAALGEQYKNYKITITADKKNLNDLVLFAPKTVKGPSEKVPFVKDLAAQPALDGLDGANIAMWQSHGWYFEPKLNRWEWQRARIFQTVEDLYTQSYVMPFLMPMLENAGAYVMSPRERDVNRTELIVDNDASSFTRGALDLTGAWKRASKPGFAYNAAELHNGDNPFHQGSALTVASSGNDKSTASAIWRTDVPEDGTYAVYVSYISEPNSNQAAHYRINAADGTHEFTVNQKMGGGTWIYLGHFPLTAGNQPVVELYNSGAKGTVVSADAVKIGGGMGNVARIVKEPLDAIDYEYVLSGYPRFTEGARYFLQWAGAPDSVYTPSDNVNDYTDDYRSRGLWVNWLTGGSSMLPGKEGLGIPVDLSFAFHSDAGTTMNDSIIGTLGIYSTAGETLGNGSSRMASRDYTDLVMTQIVDDVRAQFEPNWTRRGMWDKSYFEARVPEVPAMLLELLSHQNFADMSYGLDPNFRFTVSRAIYKGMLKFLAHRDGRPYVVQPLAINSFAIAKTGEHNYRLSWKETVDPLEDTANPTYYLVEQRINDGAFRQIARVDKPEFTVSVADNAVYSYRIIAGNNGGISFPSEILALCDMPGDPVMIVNGFTRVSAPDRFDSGEIAGFYDMRDHGVPYMKDISFIGSQFEFRRDIPWMDDDAAGFGASRANYEDKVIAGNTFDYTYTHGAAIAAAGMPFISTSLDAFIASDAQPRIVDLILGKQKEYKRGTGAYGTHYKAFPAALQQRMSTLTANGTSIFVTGAYVASDIWDNPYSDEETMKADKAFASGVLGFNWRVDQASVTGEAYQVPTRFKDFGKGEYTFYNTLNADSYAVESPDSFYPADDKKACTMMRYTENNLIAGIAYDGGNYRTVIVGFPFESIKAPAERTHLMKQVLNFFTDPNPLRKK